MRLAILDLEDAPKWKGHENLWKNLLNLPGDVWSVWRVWRGEFPKDIHSHDAYILTGSHYCVRDESEHSWITDLCEFVRKIMKDTSALIIGVCFGCQVIAHALGGKVGRNLNGRFVIGVERVQVTHHDWLLNKTDHLSLLVSHGDCVHTLPPDSLLLGSSSTAPNELFLVNGRALACQSHPEFEPSHLTDVILPSLLSKGLVPADTDGSEWHQAHLDSGVLANAMRAFIHRLDLI